MFKRCIIQEIFIKRRGKKRWEGEEPPAEGPPNKPPQTSLTWHVFMAPPKTMGEKEREAKSGKFSLVRHFSISFFRSFLTFPNKFISFEKTGKRENVDG